MISKSQNKARYGGFVKKLRVYITLALFCSPCLSYAQNSGVVVFYRDKQYQMKGFDAKIFTGSKEICRVANGAKTTLKMLSGEYILQAKPNMKHPISIKVNSNDTLFIKVHIEVAGFASAVYKMTLTDKKQGRMESDLLKEGK